MEMNESPPAGTPPAGYQREPSAVRTALPSRPMTSKPREATPSNSQELARPSVENETSELRFPGGSVSPNSRGSPANDDRSSTKATSPSSISITSKGKKSSTLGSAQGHGGQVCRLVVCFVFLLHSLAHMQAVTVVLLELRSGGDPPKVPQYAMLAVYISRPETHPDQPA